MNLFIIIDFYQFKDDKIEEQLEELFKQQIETNDWMQELERRVIDLEDDKEERNYWSCLYNLSVLTICGICVWKVCRRP